MNLKGFIAARVEDVAARLKQAKAELDHLRERSQHWTQRILALEPVREGAEELAKVRKRLEPGLRELVNEGLQRLDQLNQALADRAIPSFRRKPKQESPVTISVAPQAPAESPAPGSTEARAAAESSPESLGRAAATAAKSAKPRARKAPARKPKAAAAGARAPASEAAAVKASGKASARKSKKA